MEKKEKLAFRVSEELKEGLEEISEEVDSYPSQLARIVLQDFVKKIKKGESDLSEAKEMFGFKRPLVYTSSEYEQLEKEVEKLKENKSYHES